MHLFLAPSAHFFLSSFRYLYWNFNHLLFRGLFLVLRRECVGGYLIRKAANAS